jgi:hypothetical protein
MPIHAVHVGLSSLYTNVCLLEMLRKREEEMKIREKALQDNNERTVRLESYIKNLELEKAEYENTISTAGNRHKQNSWFCKEIREDNFRTIDFARVTLHIQE